MASRDASSRLNVCSWDSAGIGGVMRAPPSKPTERRASPLPSRLVSRSAAPPSRAPASAARRSVCGLAAGLALLEAGQGRRRLAGHAVRFIALVLNLADASEERCRATRSPSARLASVAG
jgi:hypothetical protein